MEGYVYLFIAFVSAVLIYKHIQINNTVDLVQSQFDLREYLVMKLPESQTIAEQLAFLNNCIQKLFVACQNCEPEKQECVNRMIEKYNPDKLIELKPGTKYSSYSLNKGELIKICLRKSDGTLLNDMNTSMFILCHELSHLMTVEEQHPPIFWENMKFILTKAIEAGVYQSVDYSTNPTSYCNGIVSNNPLFNEEGTYPYVN